MIGIGMSRNIQLNPFISSENTVNIGTDSHMCNIILNGYCVTISTRFWIVVKIGHSVKTLIYMFKNIYFHHDDKA